MYFHRVPIVRAASQLLISVWAVVRAQAGGWAHARSRQFARL